MDLKWVAVVIAGCIGLALCIAAVLVRPMDAERRRLRPLANVGRLTQLPEFASAMRRRMVSTVVAVTLLVVAFAGALIAGARPMGLPTTADESASSQPEDIMLCIGGPASAPAVTATLRYFAEQVPSFDTQRIGLTSSNRRVIPLTRDYQYVAGEFATFAQQDEATDLVAPVSYVDYAGGVEDLLALCLSGFPSFDRKTAERRSVIYVGPDALRAFGEPRPALFTSDRVQDMATAAGVQVNVILTGSGTGTLASLARDTGGLSFTADSDLATDLTEIRDNPPAPTAVETDETATRSAESPHIPVLLALLAATALTGWPLVMRR